MSTHTLTSESGRREHPQADDADTVFHKLCVHGSRKHPDNHFINILLYTADNPLTQHGQHSVLLHSLCKWVPLCVVYIPKYAHTCHICDWISASEIWDSAEIVAFWNICPIFAETKGWYGREIHFNSHIPCAFEMFITTVGIWNLL